jgi:hypothetical protein
MTRRKLDRQQLVVLVVCTAIQAVVGTVTVRDVSRRPPELVRGPKLLWKIWGGSNTLGSAVYWLFGRKKQA